MRPLAIPARSCVVLAAIVLSLEARPSVAGECVPAGAPSNLAVRPLEVGLGVDNQLITVTVTDAERNRLCEVPVDFATADPDLAYFPFPRAYTGDDGIAYNVISPRSIEDGPASFETTFSVSSGEVSEDRRPVHGRSFHGDGPYKFMGPPLQPFFGRHQRFVGTIFNLFELLQVRDTVKAWSVDRSVAEISRGTVIATRTGGLYPEADVAFTVTAKKHGRAIFIVATVDLTPYESKVTGDLDPPSFFRGECDGNGAVDLTDAVCLFSWLFLSGRAPDCIAATNVNYDVETGISDGIYLLTYLFLGGPPPAAPFPDCGAGTSPADAELGCEAAPGCP